MTTTTNAWIWVIHPNNETTPVFTTQAAAEIYAMYNYGDDSYHIFAKQVMSLDDVEKEQAKWNKLKLEG
jgi:hypothetical protein